MPKRLLFFFLVLSSLVLPAQQADSLIAMGWRELVKDNDSAAITAFEQAYELSVHLRNYQAQGDALLHLGMCFYGVSAAKGLQYCDSAQAAYEKSKNQNSVLANTGLNRCLQLRSTIYARQGKLRESINWSMEALKAFPKGDLTGTRGVIFTSLGSCYNKLKQFDSARYYFEAALEEHRLTNQVAYLPLAYVNVGKQALKAKAYIKSREFFDQGLQRAKNSNNQQAIVSALLAQGDWQMAVSKKDSAAYFFKEAERRAVFLNDKSFLLKTLEKQVDWLENEGKYKEVAQLQTRMITLKDSMFEIDEQNLRKKLEVQFNVAEKDRQLKLVQNEKNVALLSNYILWLSVFSILIIAALIIFFLRRNHSRDKQLLQAKEELVHHLEEQKRLREKFLQSEIEHQESQLSSLALQMAEKNELIQEISDKLTLDTKGIESEELKKALSKGMSREKDWKDFNAYFESINKNFYIRLKEAYPEISPNDLRLCALIKMNRSIKEMAVILNISPDSVKTARYRLRKKLQLQTEDNLTDFILKL